MLRKNSVLLAVFLSGSASAQPDAVEQKDPLLGDGYLLYGVTFQRETYMTLADWKVLFPDSELFQNAISTPDQQGSRGRKAEHGSATIHLGVGLDLMRTKIEGVTETKQLRVGLQYSANNTNHGQWYRSASAAYDTLISQLSGEQYPIDTIWSERYQATHDFSRLGLDVAYVFVHEGPSRLSWQLGFGILLGTTLNGRGEITRHRERRIDGLMQGNSLGQDIEYWHRTLERFAASSTIWAGCNAVVGFAYGVLPSETSGSKLHLLYELRPTLLFYDEHGDRFRSMRAAGQHLFGLRVDLR